MGASVGRDWIVEYAIADETAIPASLTLKRLGMMRDKKIDTSWDKADTTADQSPAFTKTSLVTFKSVTFTGSGVSYSEAAYNQDEVRTQAISPGSATGNQPKIWFKLTNTLTGANYFGPFIIDKFGDAAPYADAVTWDLGASSNGDVVYTPGA